MQKLKLQSIAAEAVTRIEICLPKVFPWKLRGGISAPRRLSQSPSPTLEEN